MYDTLYNSGNGIGLAAPQVGILKRVIVIDIKTNEKSNPMTFVNPKILSKSEETFSNEEGCLSIPDFYANIERFREINLEWQDEKGNRKFGKHSGLMSICLQHEIDHLNGILFIDYLSKIKRKLATEKVSKRKFKKN